MASSAIEKKKGIIKISTHVGLHTLTVIYDDRKIKLEDISKTLKDARFPAKSVLKTLNKDEIKSELTEPEEEEDEDEREM